LLLKDVSGGSGVTKKKGEKKIEFFLESLKSQNSKGASWSYEEAMII